MSYKILMVCLGNICRSPIAHGLMQKKIEEQNLPWQVDSAGLIDWHAGEPPHPKSVKISQQHGIDISQQRSRPVSLSDLEEYDFIFVMDRSNYEGILDLATTEQQQQKVELVLSEVDNIDYEEVPDPYGKSDTAFLEVFEMLDKATDVIVERLKESKK